LQARKENKENPRLVTILIRSGKVGEKVKTGVGPEMAPITVVKEVHISLIFFEKTATVKVFISCLEKIIQNTA